MIRWIDRFFLGLISLFLLAGCGNSDEKNATQLLNAAQTEFQKGNLNSAQLLIDSLHTTYPTLVAIRRQSDTISWQIAIIESRKNYEYADSLLLVKQPALEPLLDNFRFEKDAVYQDMGNYVPKQLRTELNTSRCYLKPMVNEHGELSIMSYYVGTPINYNRMQISANDLFMDSEEVNDADSHQYSDLGISHQTILFREKELAQIGEFIATHTDFSIKVTLMGTGTYSYYLNNVEKKLIADSYALSVYLSDMYELQQQAQKNKVRVQRLEQRLSINNNK